MSGKMGADRRAQDGKMNPAQVYYSE